MKAIRPIAYLFCAALLVFATWPRLRPHNIAAQSPRSQNENRGSRQQQRLTPGSDEEWAAAMDWMKQNCPNRIRFFQNRLANRPGEQQKAKQLILQQYRQVENIQDPPLHNAMVHKARAEDNIFGVQLQYRAALQRGNAIGQTRAKALLEDSVGDLNNAEVEIRQARMEQLRKEIVELTRNRREWIANVTKKEMNQAEAPPGRVTGDAEIDHQE